MAGRQQGQRGNSRSSGAHGPVVVGIAPDGREMLLIERAQQWRDWLEDHHGTVDGVWLVSWRSVTGRPRMTYEESIEAALRVGWIDSHVRRMDDERIRLLHTPRRRGSVWSALNKQRVARLAASGDLLPAGLAAVERAKADGSWEALEASDRLEVPPDLAAALDAVAGARQTYDAWPATTRKLVIYQVTSAKRDATRERRIDLVVTAAREGRRP